MKGFAVLGVLVSIPLILLYAILSNGYVLYKSFEWLSPYIAPDSHYILSYKGAVAVNALYSVLVFKISKTDDNKKPKYDSTDIIASLVSPWFLLFMIWIISEVIYNF